MKIMKKYLNIKQVSKLVGLKEHVIRYWDSIDPKTNKLRVDGISTKTKGGTRYFNKDNISKIQNLKNLIYEEGNLKKPSIKIADKLISSKINTRSYVNTPITSNVEKYPKNIEKIHQILKKMKYLVN